MSAKPSPLEIAIGDFGQCQRVLGQMEAGSLQDGETMEQRATAIGIQIAACGRAHDALKAQINARILRNGIG